MKKGFAVLTAAVLTAAAVLFQPLSRASAEPEGVDYTDENVINYTFTGENTVKLTSGEHYINNALVDIWGIWSSHPMYICGSPNAVGDIVIPSEVEGRTVKAIGAYALLGSKYSYEAVSTVYVPASVTEIGTKALGYRFVLEWLGGSVWRPRGNPLETYEYETETTEDYVEVFWDSAFDNITKNTDFVIYGHEGTAAEKYAKDNGFKFVSVEYNPDKWADETAAYLKNSLLGVSSVGLTYEAGRDGLAFAAYKRDRLKKASSEN